MSKPQSPKRKEGIPSWQQGSDTDILEPVQTPPRQQQEADQQATNSIIDATPPSNEDYASQVEHAKRFLLDKDVQDEAMEHKRAFLEQKGLSSKAINEAVASIETSTLNAPTQSQDVTIPSTASAEPREIPPIITYPEHLFPAAGAPQKPPPLVTTMRLLNTAYVAASAATLVWGLHKYLGKPLFEALTAARHDFAAHVQERLEELNEKLGSTVSDAGALNVGAQRYLDDEDDRQSDDSDPTELFHRDFGTQTEDAASSSSSSGFGADAHTSDATGVQVSALGKLTHLCEDLTERAGGEESETHEVNVLLGMLREQLDNMVLSGNAFTPYGNADAFRSGSANSSNDDDEVGKFKAEIRGMKGALLSARNFPSVAPTSMPAR